MSVVRFIPHVNRLGKAMSGPGGKKASQALADADMALQEIAPTGLEALDEALANIIQSVRSGETTTETLQVIYENANQINTLGGLLGLGAMGEAAWSLCDLVDLCEANPPSARAAIDAHVKSLQLLRAGDALSPAEQGAVLAGLKRLLAHIRDEAG